MKKRNSIFVYAAAWCLLWPSEKVHFFWQYRNTIKSVCKTYPLIFTNVCKALQHLQTGTAARARARGKGQCWKLLCTSKAQRGLIYLSWISKYFFCNRWQSPPKKRGRGSGSHRTSIQPYTPITRFFEYPVKIWPDLNGLRQNNGKELPPHYQSRYCQRHTVQEHSLPPLCWVI